MIQFMYHRDTPVDSMMIVIDFAGRLDLEDYVRKDLGKFGVKDFSFTYRTVGYEVPKNKGKTGSWLVKYVYLNWKLIGIARLPMTTTELLDDAEHEPSLP